MSSSRRPARRGPSPSVGQRLRGAVDALFGPGRRDSAVFAGASFNRLLLDWIASCLAPDQEVRRDLKVLRARARDLARNNSWIKNYLRLLVQNVIGPNGLRLVARVKSGDVLDSATNRSIETAWNAWAKSRVTVDGKLNLVRLERILLRTLAMDGEVFVRIYRGFEGNPFGLAFQPIDADLVDETLWRVAGPGSNEVRMGVEVDRLGRPVAYHVWNHAFDGYTPTERVRERIPAEDVLHLYDPDRINQTRGVTWLTSGMVPVKMLAGYEEAELVAARTGAAKMATIQAKSTDAVDVSGPTDLPAEMEANPGSIEILPAGWELASWDPDHPTAAFPNFLKSMLRSIASGLGVSYNALASDLEGVNYSSMRSGLLIERETWQTSQTLWIDLFRIPITVEFLNLAILTGRLRLPSAVATDYVDSIQHRPRGWSYVDPAKEMTANEKALALGLTSRRRILAEQGQENVEDIFGDLEEENDLAETHGLSVAPPAPGSSAPPAPADEDEDDQAAAGRSNGNGSINRIRERTSHK